MMRVLIVEDDAVHALIIRRLLTDIPGVLIDVAPDLATARAALSSCDLAVVDIHLPDGEGTEIAPMATAMGVPLAWMSGAPAERLAALAAETGCPAISKEPEGNSQLRALVRAFSLRARADSRLIRLTAMEGGT